MGLGDSQKSNNWQLKMREREREKEPGRGERWREVERERKGSMWPAKRVLWRDVLTPYVSHPHVSWRGTASSPSHSHTLFHTLTHYYSTTLSFFLSFKGLRDTVTLLMMKLLSLSVHLSMTLSLPPSPRSVLVFHFRWFFIWMRLRENCRRVIATSRYKGGWVGIGNGCGVLVPLLVGLHHRSLSISMLFSSLFFPL